MTPLMAIPLLLVAVNHGWLPRTGHASPLRGSSAGIAVTLADARPVIAAGAERPDGVRESRRSVAARRAACEGPGTQDKPCDDGNSCTFNDVCTINGCAGTPYSCEDGNVCTSESCDGAGGCRFLVRSGPCDDGIACTFEDTCVGALCRGTTYDCEDGIDCTTDSCDGAGGCDHSVCPGPCDDGDRCTINDVCTAGGCAGTPLDCDDANACTDDNCDPFNGCSHSFHSRACDDGKECTLDDVCAAGICRGTPTATCGCADGQREAFVDEAVFPGIAGCAGGFSLPGVIRITGPACGRSAGDDGANPSGNGCNVEDLCSEGWHVCASSGDVATHAPGGCAAIGAPPHTFFVTRQSGPGCFQCATGFEPDCSPTDCASYCAPSDLMANDVFGCGTLGVFLDPVMSASSCAPLDRSSAGDCSLSLAPPWSCPSLEGLNEAHVVVKPGADSGGVLCCRN